MNFIFRFVKTWQIEGFDIKNKLALTSIKSDVTKREYYEQISYIVGARNSSKRL